MAQELTDVTRIITRPGDRVYHLDLSSEEIAESILTVGDPLRINKILPHFESIELERSYREFRTVTGKIRGRRVSAIATGMGSDNIDIVMNELELLANWDISKREPLTDRQSLKIVRLGTSGALQPHLPVDTLLLSKQACSMDLVHHFYPLAETDSLGVHLQQFANKHRLPKIYNFKGGSDLISALNAKSDFVPGLTFTASGFYAPQGRRLWEKEGHLGILDQLSDFRMGDMVITNVEMETAALYHLGEVFGHQMASISALLANRPNGEFSQKADQTIDQMIEVAIDNLL